MDPANVGTQFSALNNESDDWELDYPNPNRRYTVVSHHGADRDNPEVRKAHFNTFEQAKEYGKSLYWNAIPNPSMSYTEKDGYSAAVYDRDTKNHWGVILHGTKHKGRWRPYRDGDRQ